MNILDEISPPTDSERDVLVRKYLTKSQLITANDEELCTCCVPLQELLLSLPKPFESVQNDY